MVTAENTYMSTSVEKTLVVQIIHFCNVLCRMTFSSKALQLLCSSPRNVIQSTVNFAKCRLVRDGLKWLSMACGNVRMRAKVHMCLNAESCIQMCVG